MPLRVESGHRTFCLENGSFTGPNFAYAASYLRLWYHAARSDMGPEGPGFTIHPDRNTDNEQYAEGSSCCGGWQQHGHG